MDAKLSWNVNVDTNELIDKWFNAMFKDAAPIMKRLYQEETNYSLIMLSKADQLKASYLDFNADQIEYWDYGTLLGWLDIIDEARDAIIGYKIVNPELYAVLKEHIDIEWISPAYALMKIYGESYLDPTLYQSIISYFKNDIYQLPTLYLHEDLGMSGALQTWIKTLP